MTKKKTQGRKKIEMKKIDDSNSLQVAFSKRRAGLFRKASELCVLTGAETAILVESPGKRVFAFGHPSVDSVVDQYVAGSSEKAVENTSNEADLKSHDKLIQEYLEISKKLEDEKSKKIDVVEGDNFWWEEPFNDLGPEELEKFIAALEVLKSNVTQRADEMKMIRNSSMFGVNQARKTEG